MSPRRVLFDFACGFLEARARAPIVEWAERNLYLIDGNGVLTGYVDTESYPYIREPLESMADPAVKSVVLCWSAQSLKSTSLMINAGYRLAMDPTPILWVMDTRTSAVKFSIDRWQRFVEASECLRALKPKDGDLFKNMEMYFQSATLMFAGSNSAGSLASFPAGLVIGDEEDKYPPARGKEAAPVENAVERMAGNPYGKEIHACTPTVEDGVIWRAFKMGDQRHFYVPCPSCTRFLKFEFAGLKWDPEARNKDGLWDLPEVRRSAYYECPACMFSIGDSHKLRMLRAGEWRPDAPEGEGVPRQAGCRSYRINRLYSTLPSGSFGEIACRHILAGKDPSKRQAFSNSVLAEPYGGDVEGIEIDALARCENYMRGKAGVLPEPVLVLTAGVDVQKDRLEAELVGWGIGEESWGLGYRIFMGDPERGEVWDGLDAWLLKEWAHPLGQRLKAACVCVDSGFLTERVYDFVQPRHWRRVYAVKGFEGQPGAPLVSRPGKSSVQRVTLFRVCSYTANEYVYSRLRVDEPGPCFCHFASVGEGYDEEFFKQLTAEKLERRRVNGRVVRRWVKPGAARNEALDVRGYAAAAFTILNADLPVIAQQMELKLEADKDERRSELDAELKEGFKEAARATRRRPQVGKGFVGRW